MTAQGRCQVQPKGHADHEGHHRELSFFYLCKDDMKCLCTGQLSTVADRSTCTSVANHKEKLWKSAGLALSALQLLIAGVNNRNVVFKQ